MYEINQNILLTDHNIESLQLQCINCINSGFDQARHVWRPSCLDHGALSERLAIKKVLRMQGGQKPFSQVAISCSPKHCLMYSRFCLVWTLLLCIWKNRWVCLVICLCVS